MKEPTGSNSPKKERSTPEQLEQETTALIEAIEATAEQKGFVNFGIAIEEIRKRVQDAYQEGRINAITARRLALRINGKIDDFKHSYQFSDKTRGLWMDLLGNSNQKSWSDYERTGIEDHKQDFERRAREILSEVPPVLMALDALPAEKVIEDKRLVRETLDALATQAEVLIQRYDSLISQRKDVVALRDTIRNLNKDK